MKKQVKITIGAIVAIVCLFVAYKSWGDYLPFYLPFEPKDMLARRAMVTQIKRSYAGVEIKELEQFVDHPDGSAEGIWYVGGHNGLGMPMDHRILVYVNSKSQVTHHKAMMLSEPIE